MLLIVGMRIKYMAHQSGTSSLSGLELRVLLNSMGQFINLGLLSVLTTCFERFSETEVSGKIIFRTIRTLYPCCNVFLTFILDKPLRQQLFSKNKPPISTSGVGALQPNKTPPTPVVVAWT
ncbi:hypothetical protein M3Y97_00652000 [Aphelenchoides bicaudatus]|nr:hypothetical protein M3Y97_00652000 [Aphelenchoides bicaudatus]